MKKWIFLIVSFLTSIPCVAQEPDTLWTRLINNSSLDCGNTIQQTTDGGFVICGYTNQDVWLVKTNPVGDTLWTKIYDSGGWDYGSAVRQTVDGGYIVIGSEYFPGPSIRLAWLIKTDQYGDILWTRSFGSSIYDNGFAVQQTSDGGYIIGANNDSGARLIKTDSFGDTIWIKNYSNILTGYSLDQTAEGGYIITGHYNSQVGLLKTNSQGDTLWTKKYFDGHGRSVRQTTDGGYIITGEDYTDWKLYLLKTDSVGNPKWMKKFTDNYELESFGNSVQQTNTSDYIITGGKTYGDFDHDIWIIKVDRNGDIIWTKSFDVYCGEAVGNSVIQTADGGYIVAGYNSTHNPQGSDLWLIRLEPDINSVNEDPLPLQAGISQNFPNPFNPVTKIIYQLPGTGFVTLKVYDILGREVATLVNEEKAAGNYEVEFNAGNLSAGVYIYTFSSGNYSAAKKLVLLK